ncbi:ABC transporter A family member 7 [Acorus calamus]|uniref:ABC transporter A family member 7 n=1 Tax=Acorus calamus TaxID=4465 RepID=A0AAV9DBJ0_ACOCL|nr:ABC transporter A family member 7 [Acorus calamus]
MDGPFHGPASFSAQANALMRKNLTFQKRNLRTNIRLVAFPVLLCSLLVLIQSLIDSELNKPKNRCGCTCVSTNGDGSCNKKVCGIQYSTLDQVGTCPIPSPPKWPALLQVPRAEYRASRTGSGTYADLPDDSCRATQSRPATILYTGGNQSLADKVKCVQGLHSWRSSSSAVNDEMFKGYRQGNPQKKINEIVTAYDFLNTNENSLNMIIWYNATYKNDSRNVPTALVRVPRSLNMVSNAYLQFLKGANAKMQLEYVKEMPQPGKKLSLDFASLLGALFFKWVIELLFPVILTYLVYEKQEKLKIMMKMHGLGDGPYWIISYAYFFSISVIYIFLFVVFGSVIGLKFFRLNDYSIQLVFYFIYINLQIALAFLAATAFSNVKTAQALGYIYVFGSGLLAGFLFQFFLEDLSFSRHWIRVMEILPAFALYRGLYEFSDYAFTGSYMGTSGMRWSDLSNSANGMREVLIIMFIEWLLLLPLAYYLDQLTSFGSSIQKDPLFFLHCFRKKSSASFRKPSLQKHGSKVFIDMEKPDVLQERETVEQLLLEPSTSHAIICDNLKKVYPGKDGIPDKFAVQGLSLALPRGECFGMLGPNGAGKTTFISMMIGLTKPTSGTAYVQGLDLRSNMSKIYTNMGVCPQHE